MSRCRKSPASASHLHAQAGEFLRRLNFNARRKFWEIDHNDGEIRPAYTDTMVGPLTDGGFCSLLHCLIMRADTVFPYLTSVLSGRIPEMRVKWWIELAGKNCREAIFPDNPEMPEVPLLDIPKTGYSLDAPPTFFGHYALKDPKPAPIRSNLACLDYGSGKQGFLCAYRWDGESILCPSKFVTEGNQQGVFA
ncbi:MAG: hypothetical protein WCQ57_14890 [Verrucomicrobiota bacterium]